MSGKDNNKKQSSSEYPVQLCLISSLDRVFGWFELKILGTTNAHSDSTIRRRVILLSVITMIGGMTLTLFGILAFFQDALLLGVIDICFALAFFLNILDARIRKKFELNIGIGICLAALLYICLYANGGVDRTAHVWYYTFPLMASFLLGAKRGAIAMVLMTIPVITLSILNIQHPLLADYPANFEIRFLFSYLLVGVFAYFFEKAGENNRQEILLINKNLERIVGARTRELTEINQQLREQISQHKQAQQELLESETRFKSLIDLSVVGILLGSSDGCISEANKRICEIIGIEREDLIGLHISKLPFTEESLEQTPFRFDLIRIGENVVREREIVRSDGTHIIVEMRTTMMPDGTYQSIFSDITQRYQMEQDLRESEERFRALHNASFGGIVIHDQGIIIDCNQGLSDMTGYSVAELINMDGLELIAEKWRDLVVKNIQEGYEQVYEAEAVRKDGTIYPVHLRGSMIPYKGRTVRVTEFRDITERKQADEEKLRLEAQLFQSQKMETVGQLAGGIAHDFNNMLGVIIGHAEMAMFKKGDVSLIHDDLAKIRTAAERSTEITRQLLAFARKQTVEPKSLSLNETVEGMLQMLKRLIGEDIELIWNPGADLWRVRMDTSQLDQILVNLCLNARDAIAGVGKIIVTTENILLDEKGGQNNGVTSSHEYVRLTVSDNGSGMDEETISHVFEPFFTTKDVGEGTGLGLATVYGAVKQNNGIISVDSRPGQGTTLKISIPRHSNITAEEFDKKDEQQAIGGDETILIVEDETIILEMGEKMLKMLGYKVLAAEAPAEAIRIAQEHPGDIHLLLTDVIMPGMNGRDLANRLKVIKPQAKCLFMSGYTANIIANQGMLDDGVNLIQKPFSQQALAQKIRSTLAA